MKNGVLGGVASALHVLCSQGDHVLVHAPTYIGFTGTLTNNGYHIIHSNLKKDDNDIWRMDFEDMEEKIVKNKIHAAIFCSPHNPTGRVWERWEIEKAMELYAKYDVTVISDEIWSDIILDGHQHIPTQSVSEDAKNRTVALYAPSKTFNLAGLIGSYHIIYNRTLRERIIKESSLCHYNSMNVLSMYALIGAYKSEGCEWVDELRQVIGEMWHMPAIILTSISKVCMYPDHREHICFSLTVKSGDKAHGKTAEELLKMGYEGRSVLAEWKSISWRVVYSYEPRTAEFQSERSI